MRRKDREMSKDYAFKIVDKAKYGVVSLIEEHEPYGIPLSIIVELVEDEKEKIKAMRLICEKYTPEKMKYFDMAIKAGLKRTNVYKVEIEEITSKRKKYDVDGEEMKWGRME